MEGYFIVWDITMESIRALLEEGSMRMYAYNPAAKQGIKGRNASQCLTGHYSRPALIGQDGPLTDPISIPEGT